MIQLSILKITEYGPWTLTLGSDREHELQMLQASLYKQVQELFSAKKITKLPIVAIGGIKLNNYKKLLLNKANFLAISGYIWNNKKLKPLEAIKKLK